MQESNGVCKVALFSIRFKPRCPFPQISFPAAHPGINYNDMDTIGNTEAMTAEAILACNLPLLLH